jgi:hypothetical protein
VVPKLWVATRKWVAKPCHVGRQLVPRKNFFTQQRVATIQIVVHWVAKKPEKFKWVSSQKSLGTTVLLHASYFRWAKNITLSLESGIFYPDTKMLKVHQNAPTSILKSENFSGGDTPDPRIKRKERDGEGVRVGKGGEGRG